MVRFFFSISVILLLHACGKPKFPDYNDDTDLQREKHEEGEYGAKFTLLNAHKSGGFKAHSVLWTRGNQFYVRVILSGGQPRVRHIQSIHAGGRCPQSSDDRNGDKILDYAEVMQSTGPMLIPLDRSLISQSHGNEWYPTSDGIGTMNYSRSTAITDLMEDLRRKDPVSEDYLSKLNIGETLDLDQRTIIIYGTSTDPMLPIACAEIFKEFE